MKDKRSGVSGVWSRLTEGWMGVLFYSFVGVVFALAASQVLSFALSTDLPVVAVVSQSMQHDSAEQTYYQWLEGNMHYSRDYIDSWPVPTGFFVGDMPIVSGSPDSAYEVGDVIVYSVPGQKFPIIHRIIKINSDGTYQTKGDNNLNQWPYELSVTPEQIHGKVIFIVPKLGYIKVAVSQIFGL
jgi:alkylated DNA nucleotide flippase Atl1